MNFSKVELITHRVSRSHRKFIPKGLPVNSCFCLHMIKGSVDFSPLCSLAPPFKVLHASPSGIHTSPPLNVAPERPQATQPRDPREHPSPPSHPHYSAHSPVLPWSQESAAPSMRARAGRNGGKRSCASCMFQNLPPYAFAKGTKRKSMPEKDN